MRISDWSSDVCSSDLLAVLGVEPVQVALEVTDDDITLEDGRCRQLAILEIGVLPDLGPDGRVQPPDRDIVVRHADGAVDACDAAVALQRVAPEDRDWDGRSVV